MFSKSLTLAAAPVLLSHFVAASPSGGGGISLDVSLDINIGGGHGHDSHNDAHNSTTFPTPPPTTIPHPHNPPFPPPSHFSLPLPYTTLAQLPSNGTLLENIAVRPNGDLLITQNQPEPVVYLIREPWNSYLLDPELAPLHKFSPTLGSNKNSTVVDGVLGIAQLPADDDASDSTFVVATIGWADPASPAPGSATLRYLRLGEGGEEDSEAAVLDNGYVGRYPGAGFLNGIVAVEDANDNGGSAVVLAADSMAGVVRRMDLSSEDGKDGGEGGEVVLDLPGMKVHDKEAVMPLGINGLRVFGEWLYWTNSNTRQIFRVCLDGTAAEEELVADLSGEAGSLDDFTFDKAGNIWVVTNVDNKLMVVRPDGSNEVVLGGEGEMAVAGATSAAFGRSVWDEHVLYVTTTGATQFPVNGTVVEPGKVVAVDTRGFY